jgi:aconitate hydratase
VKAVIAKSFERIHRSNLVGMGVLPLQFKPGEGADALGIKGDEMFSITGLEKIEPQMEYTLTIRREDRTSVSTIVISRIDTPIEVDYYKQGGILPFVLKQLLT